jgi:nitrogenase molybdenum-iron protein alpha/beta subunit/MoaA/NifB/PqqE/SkfB family radical SAM enzyme
MASNYVNLNVNPCKMCMPMGAMTAFYGIRGCVSILHGSQGCSTYIRRHMATHYNEPVDIASSSLTEQGTVFGGESNLIKGLENLIKLYNPEVIGVATTCLAETIGEDINGIIKKFLALHPDAKAKIIPVSSAGYGGTQYEGFFKALKAIVSNIEMSPEKNDMINIIVPLISPADTRHIKDICKKMGLNCIILPDISENLDGGYEKNYSKLPRGGTSIEEIAKMGGARYTLELSAFVPEENSPAKYLKEAYGVPYERLDLPVGLEFTDAFIEKLVSLGGEMTDEIKDMRKRYLDAMIDSHKYNAECRAVVFGEPDFASSVVKLCCENGALPVVAATGSVCKEFREKLGSYIKPVAEIAMEENFAVLDDIDFEKIENLALELKANLMIGSSDGRKISERHGIELIRCAFPVHDRVGGQRTRILCYEGSLELMDKIANSILARKEENFRHEAYEKYFDKKAGKEVENQKMDLKTENLQKTLTHPCYTCSAGKYARIHLPVAPKCNIQCNYCVRKYDCPNESRPGVTTEILSPREAFEKYALIKEKMDNLKVVGIAGPGDALANFEQTKETLKLIKEYDKEVTFCLSTNGLMLPMHAKELIDLGVSHVTVTMNAVDPKIGAKIYKHIDYMGVRYEGETGAAILLANQIAGLKYLTSNGAICKVNIVMLKGINDGHIEEVVKTAKELGCEITNIMQLIPVKGSAFEELPLVSNKELMEIRKKCEVHMKQMHHCRQCRADAIGTLDNDVSIQYRSMLNDDISKAKTLKKKFAVASKSGMLVDQHFGHADEFYIYESDGENARFVEKRAVRKYCSGADDCGESAEKMDLILKAVGDCDAVIALRMGDSPMRKLKEKGIEIYITYDSIEHAVKNAVESAIKL